MRVKERKRGDVVVMSLTGDFMNDVTLDRFIDRLEELKDQGVYKVVLDMGGVRLINSVGIGTIIGSYKTLRGMGGDLKLANLSPKTFTILVAVSKLPLDIFESVDEAVTSFAVSAGTA